MLKELNSWIGRKKLESFLLSISGRDQRGLLARLTEHLDRLGAQISDSGQAVIHDELALAMIIHTDQEKTLNLAICDVCERLDVRFELSETKARRIHEASSVDENNLILTLMTRGRSASALHSVSRLAFDQNLNVDFIRQLSSASLNFGGDRTNSLCVEMRVSGSTANAIAAENFRKALLPLSESEDFDCSVQYDSVYRKNRRLVALDMDSTLIQQEVMDELGASQDRRLKMSQITKKAMDGELDFKKSFLERAALLKNVPISALDEVIAGVELNEGAHRLIKSLRHFGYKTCLISGGFQEVGDYFANELGIDYVRANRLEIVNGKFTGKVKGEIIDADKKAELLEDISAKEGISLAQTIAVGDGANDLPMLSKAGLGVAYRAKPVVKEQAKHAISHFGLDAILYLIGFSDADIEEALMSAS